MCSPATSAATHSVVGMADRYGSDVLASDWRAPKRGRAVEAAAERGAVVEEVTDVTFAARSSRSTVTSTR